MALLSQMTSCHALGRPYGAGQRPCALGRPVQPSNLRRGVTARAEGDAETQSVDKELMSADELRQLEKQQEIERLRAAEKFMKISSGRAQCKGCGYTYDPSVGDPEYPVAKGTQFSDLPDDWLCPVCGLDKKKFEEEAKEIAGFAANQGYGFGTNTWTGEQKSLVIYGALAGSFLLFLLGYFIQ